MHYEVMKLIDDELYQLDILLENNDLMMNNLVQRQDILMHVSYIQLLLSRPTKTIHLYLEFRK